MHVCMYKCSCAIRECKRLVKRVLSRGDLSDGFVPEAEMGSDLDVTKAQNKSEINKTANTSTNAKKIRTI